MESRGPLRLRALEREGSVCRVAVVQSAAMLLAGDRVGFEIDVAGGASCVVEEISATLAHPVADMPEISSSLRIRVAENGRLIVREQPLILAAGTRLARSSTIELSGTASVCHREILVLGRHAESGGRATVRTRVTRDGSPVYDDTIDTSSETVLRSPAVLDRSRVLGTQAMWGLPEIPPGHGAMVLGPRDLLKRVLAPDSVSVTAALEDFETAMSQAQ